MNLIVGLYDSENEAGILKNVMEGLLDGIELTPYKMNLAARKSGGKENQRDEILLRYG